MNTLKVILELQKEINDYCDPNERVKEMIQRFVEVEADLETQARLFRDSMAYEIEQRATERTSHE